MKIYGYCDSGYKAQQVQFKETTKDLLNEAIAARLTAGKITADEFAFYAAIMNEAEQSLDYANKQLAEEQAKAINGEGDK